LVFFLLRYGMTITDGACSPSTVNAARLTYGCDHDGCTNASCRRIRRTWARCPELRVLRGTLRPPPYRLRGDIPVTIRNLWRGIYERDDAYLSSGGLCLQSSRQLRADATGDHHPPSQRLRIQVGSDPGRYQRYRTLRIHLACADQEQRGERKLPCCQCTAITATVSFDNHWICSTPGPWTVTQTATLDVLTPVLAISKSPRTQTAMSEAQLLDHQDHQQRYRCCGERCGHGYGRSSFYNTSRLLPDR
jgi:hypothetical protein